MILAEQFKALTAQIHTYQAQLVAVSKFQTIEKIEALYALGQRDFGENYVQELVTKYEYFKAKPEFQDIRWHFIGHLQRNKVKYIAPFVAMIHGVDSFKLLVEINKEAEKNAVTIPCLMQIFIATEESKFGMDATEAIEFMSYYQAQKEQLQHITLAGVMGMASFSNNESLVRSEFQKLISIKHMLKSSYMLAHPNFKEVSMGMSADYEWALAEGSTLVRIGSMLFGAR